MLTNSNFTTVHPVNSKARVAQALTEFTDDFGVPDTLLSDGDAEVTGQHTDVMKEVNRLKIRLRRSETGWSNQNYAGAGAGREIGKVKKRWRNRMLESKVPLCDDTTVLPNYSTVRYSIITLPESTDCTMTPGYGTRSWSYVNGGRNCTCLEVTIMSKVPMSQRLGTKLKI
jgi:hypothetical protein